MPADEENNDVLAGALEDGLKGVEEPESEMNVLGDFAKELLGGDETPGKDESETEETSEEDNSDEEVADEATETEETDTSEGETKSEESDETSDDSSEESDTEEEEEVPEDPPKGSSKKASEDWKKLRGSRDKYKTEAAEVRETLTAKEQEVADLQAKVAELEELRGKAALSDELQAKLDRFDEMEREIAILDVERSQPYIESVKEPLAAIEAQAQSLATENEADVNAIYDALAEQDPAKQRVKLKEVTAGWDEIDKVELRTMAADARTLLNKQQEMRQNAHATKQERDRLAAEEAEKQAAARKQEFEKASKAAIEELRQRVPFVPVKDGETEDDRFALVAEKLKQVDFDGNSAGSKALAAASTLVLPSALKTIEKLQSEVKALEKRLASKNSAKPGKSEAESKPAEEEEDFFKSLGIETLDASQRLNVTG